MNELFDLSGRSALVTGSTRGIGRAIASEMAAAGARVAISSNEREACTTIAAEIGHDAIALPCDVARDDEIEGLVDEAVRQMGGLDILVCNAGLNSHHGPAAATRDEDYDLIMRVNARSAFKLCNKAAPWMAAHGGGVILITSSLSGLRGNRAISAYGMSKAANAQLARNLAVEWGPSGVRANAISPGLIETDFAATIVGNPDHLAKRLLQTPLRRTGTPREVAGCAVFLASPAGAFVSGHNLVCDGGTLVSD